MELEALLPQHGGYRRLKSFQIAPLCYDVTVRFCDRSRRLARGAFFPRRSGAATEGLGRAVRRLPERAGDHDAGGGAEMVQIAAEALVEDDFAGVARGAGVHEAEDTIRGAIG